MALALALALALAPALNAEGVEKSLRRRLITTHLQQTQFSAELIHGPPQHEWLAAQAHKQRIEGTAN